MTMNFVTYWNLCSKDTWMGGWIGGQMERQTDGGKVNKYMDNHYYYYKFCKQGQSTCIPETFKASQRTQS